MPDPKLDVNSLCWNCSTASDTISVYDSPYDADTSTDAEPNKNPELTLAVTLVSQVEVRSIVDSEDNDTPSVYVIVCILLEYLRGTHCP